MTHRLPHALAGLGLGCAALALTAQTLAAQPPDPQTQLAVNPDNTWYIASQSRFGRNQIYLTSTLSPVLARNVSNLPDFDAFCPRITQAGARIAVVYQARLVGDPQSTQLYLSEFQNNFWTSYPIPYTQHASCPTYLWTDRAGMVVQFNSDLLADPVFVRWLGEYAFTLPQDSYPTALTTYLPYLGD